MIETVGGCSVLLGIIAMARDMESLYAGVKALVCVLKSNPFAHYEMEANKGNKRCVNIFNLFKGWESSTK